MTNEYIGYIKYSGKSVDEGIMDARKSAEALLGFDEAIRYFASKEEPFLINENYELLVKIQKGSWEIILPMIQELMTPEGIVKTAGTAYLTNTAIQSAKEGFFQVGLSKDIKTIFLGAFKALKWIVKIVKHIGSFNKKIEIIHDLENAKVEIINEKGHKLIVSREIYVLYQECPETILTKLASNIEKDRVLKIGVFQDKQEVIIDEQEKEFFYIKPIVEDSDLLYPELKDGDEVTLEGNITKVNEKANTLGFQHDNHILTIMPVDGNVTDFKSEIISTNYDNIFQSVTIVGIIDRKGNNGEILKKPKVIFESLQKIDDKNALF